MTEAEKAKKLADEKSTQKVADEAFQKAVDTAVQAELEKRQSVKEDVEEIVKPEPVKMVSIKLFKDTGEYKDDVFVAVNGMRYQIQRGIEVEVPMFVKEVLDNSSRQDQLTAELIEREVAKAEKASK